MSSIKLDGITLASTANSKAVLDSGVVFPAGHIIQQITGSHTYTGDAGVAGGTEVFGPVVNLTCVNANAKIFALITMPEVYMQSSSLSTIGIAFKTSSFSASDGTGLSSSGATLVTTDNTKIRKGHGPATISVLEDIANTAGQTIYFSAFCTGTSNTFYWNYAGNAGATGKITVMEIQK